MLQSLCPWRPIPGRRLFQFSWNAALSFLAEPHHKECFGEFYCFVLFFCFVITKACKMGTHNPLYALRSDFCVLLQLAVHFIFQVMFYLLYSDMWTVNKVFLVNIWCKCCFDYEWNLFWHLLKWVITFEQLFLVECIHYTSIHILDIQYNI